MTRATGLGAWAVLYAPVTYLWWPTCIIAVLLGLTARWRTRAAADSYSRLVEAAVRLHARDLAQRLAADAPAGCLPTPATGSANCSTPCRRRRSRPNRTGSDHLGNLVQCVRKPLAYGQHFTGAEW